MHAVFVEVNNEHTDMDLLRSSLERGPVPRVRDAGASAAYWLAPAEGRGLAVIVFDSEERAQQLANQLHVGQAPDGAPEGITFRTVEVREVLASV